MNAPSLKKLIIIDIVSFGGFIFTKSGTHLFPEQNGSGSAEESCCTSPFSFFPILLQPLSLYAVRLQFWLLDLERSLLQASTSAHVSFVSVKLKGPIYIYI